MLNEKVSQLLNDQVNKEFYSAYLYLQFSNFYVEQGLAGFANWYKVQAQEERDHAMLMLQYLQNNDVPVTLEAVAKPDAELKANMDPLKAGLAHEQYVTSLIHAIYEAAYEARDFRTMQFLDWFVKEQGEEEGAVRLGPQGARYAGPGAGGPDRCRPLPDPVTRDPATHARRPVRRAFLLPALDGGGRPWYTGRSLIPRRFPDERPADRGG